ncbi:MAG: hypothetical protein K0R19_1922 [Bacillota bacterium]|jgi:hypothetical protein|nr:hypothetical protein [Bacillota bacterium]
MKQIYDFNRKSPPVITENMIRAEMERLKLQRETALLATGSLLIVLCLFIMAVTLYDSMPLLSIACAVYIYVSAAGGSVIALVLTQKRRSLIK